MGSENDPIADLLTRLRNGSMARHRFIDISWSKMKESIVRILKEEGYVAHYLVKEVNKKGSIRVFLKYGADRSPVFLGLKRVSRSSLRRYVACQEIPRVLGNVGTAIISTSYGVMTGQKAKEKNIGGEVLCTVW